MYMYILGTVSVHKSAVLVMIAAECTVGHTSESSQYACFNEREQRSNQSQTNNKAKQHSTPNEAVIFPKKINCLGCDSNPRHSTL